MTRTSALLLISLMLAGRAQAVIIDRIAATIDRDVITLSEVNQTIAARIIPRTSGETDPAYRRRVLDALIAQGLRYRDVVRFGAQDVSADAIESRLRDVQGRFDSPAQFEETIRAAELTIEDVRSLVKRQLQVEAYIEERFSPLIFVSLEEIETYYNDVWLMQRFERGLPPTPLAEVREEIRTLLKAERLQREIDVWTQQLRERANVDVFLGSQ
jgi:peptidyl-prolyl cis-trans isomerase SurA